MRLFPVWEWSPCDCSPVLCVDDLRFLLELKDFPIVCVDAVNELLKGLEAEAFFFDDCDDCIAFTAVGMKHTWREGGGGVESDMRLIVKEVG